VPRTVLVMRSGERRSRSTAPVTCNLFLIKGGFGGSGWSNAPPRAVRVLRLGWKAGVYLCRRVRAPAEDPISRGSGGNRTARGAERSPTNKRERDRSSPRIPHPSRAFARRDISGCAYFVMHSGHVTPAKAGVQNQDAPCNRSGFQLSGSPSRSRDGVPLSPE